MRFQPTGILLECFLVGRLWMVWGGSGSFGASFGIWDGQLALSLSPPLSLSLVLSVFVPRTTGGKVLEPKFRTPATRQPERSSEENSRSSAGTAGLFPGALVLPSPLPLVFFPLVPLRGPLGGLSSSSFVRFLGFLAAESCNACASGTYVPSAQVKVVGPERAEAEDNKGFLGFLVWKSDVVAPR